MKISIICLLMIFGFSALFAQSVSPDDWSLVLHQFRRQDKVLARFSSSLNRKQVILQRVDGMDIVFSLDPQKSFIVFRAEARTDSLDRRIYFSINRNYDDGEAYNFNGPVLKPEIYRQSPHDVNAWIVNDIAMQAVPVIALKKQSGFEVAICGSPAMYANYTSQAFYPDQKWMALSSGDNGETPGLHPDADALKNISYNKEKTQIFTPGNIVAYYHPVTKAKSHVFEGILFHSDRQNLQGLRMDINQKAADFFSNGKYADYFGSLAFTTAYMNLRVNETGKSAFWVVPSVEYANTQYCRDAFWISMMLSDSMSTECLKSELDSVNHYAEYPLFAILWAWRAQKKNLSFDRNKVQNYLDAIEKHSRDGYYYSFNADDGRLDFQYWGDIIAFDKEDVVTYNQGLFALALLAANEMGLHLTLDPEKSVLLYQGLFNRKDGFFPISKKKNTILGPDPVLPDLLSILYLHRPLLPDKEVFSHFSRMNALLKTSFGYKVIARADGNYLQSAQYDVAGYSSQANRGHFTDGQYFRGGSFFLYDELFLIDAYLHGIKTAEDDLIWRTKLDFTIGSTTYECLNTVNGEAWKPNMGWNVAVYAIWRGLVDEGKASGKLFQSIDSICHFGGYPFRDTSMTIDQRVSDLVSRMTLSEKLSQLFNHAPAIDRLDIPAYDWWNEGLHGVARAGRATVFPQAIGLAAAFNEPLMFDIATAISEEARAKHNYFIAHHVHSIYTGLTFWSPNINIFRDPRWGRGQETYGEDPYLTGRMAVNFIRGLQGNDPRYLKTIATAKHYAVHSGPEFSRHTDDVFVNDHDLYETYLPAFKMAVREAHVQSVMCAYNRFRDQPCCGSNLLLSDILRREFGFSGYVVSDCGAISDFYTPKSHHVVETPEKAMGWSLNAGTDINCEESGAFLPENIDSGVRAGMISEENINRSVKRLFRARFKLGMFDPPEAVPYNQLKMSVVGSKQNTALSLAAAEESIVLLKNNGILPLKTSSHIALIGPNANNGLILLGNYNGQPIDPVTPLKALRKMLGQSNVLYSPGSPIVDGVYTNYESIPASQLFHFESKELKPGLEANYYSGVSIKNPPVKNQVDSFIDFNWPVSPVNGEVEDSFSVNWKGVLIPSVSDRYLFGGNLSVKIDGKPVGTGAVELIANKQYQLEAQLVVRPFWWGNTVEPGALLSWVNVSKNYEQEAIEIAGRSDLVIFCGGISSQLEGEEMPLEIDGFSHGDRTHINLPAVQEELLKRLHALGKKIVYINFSGSAVALNWENENADAILQAFYPGEKGGEAIANILFGLKSPSGRLPVTFYRSVEDLPAFKDYNMKGRTYRYFTGSALYPFGFGLSYSHFTYSNLVVPERVSCGDSVVVKIDVTNTGKSDGKEVVEIYLKRTDQNADDPLQSLVGFKKFFLRAGETQTVELKIKPEQLAEYDPFFHWIIQPGSRQVFAGGCLPDEKAIQQKLVLQQTFVLTGNRYELK